MKSLAKQLAADQAALIETDLTHLYSLLTFLDDVGCDDYGRHYWRPRVQCLQVCITHMVARIADRYQNVLQPALRTAGAVIGNNSAADGDVRIHNLKQAERVLANMVGRDDIENEEFGDCMEACRLGLDHAADRVGDALSAIDEVIEALPSEEPSAPSQELAVPTTSRPARSKSAKQAKAVPA